jgi:hypothetical protein
VDQGIMTLITVGLILAAAAFTMWLLYTVIWRAVRRGLQEFEVARWEREEQEQQQEQELEQPGAAPSHRLPHLHLPVRHRVPNDVDEALVVPDYPPSEWF